MSWRLLWSLRGERSPIRVWDGRPQGTSFDEMAIWASEILNSIKSGLHLKQVYCSRSTTHFISLTKVTNSMLVFLLKNKCEKMYNGLVSGPFHWSPTVPVSVWLPEPAWDRGSKQKTLNDDCYHTTCRSAAIFGVQTVLPYLVLTLDLWIGLCHMKRSSGVWSFGDVSVRYRSRRAMFR